AARGCGRSRRRRRDAGAPQLAVERGPVGGDEGVGGVAGLAVPPHPRRRGRRSSVTAPLRVLALSPIPEEGAGCRFRIAQFIPYLKSVGIEVTLSSLFTPEFFRLVYKPGHYMRKAVMFAALSLKRLASLGGLSRFDVVFIYREIFPIGPGLVEHLIAARRRPPIIFDFDDAIFLPSVSDANRLIGALKSPQKVAAIVQSSD